MTQQPGQGEPIVGREADIAFVQTLLDRSRFVSLTGPGGSGKTRLAQAVVASIRDTGRRSWFVGASELRDPELLAPAVAAALDPDASASPDPVEAIAEALGAADAYIALDNLEQMPGAGAEIESLLDRVPGLRVLATTRVRLGGRGEAEFLVPTLGQPVSDDPSSVKASPSGALFLRRAEAVGFTTDLDVETAREIATLLRRLDGLPLAIELAAARTRIIRPAEILYWLDERGLAAVDAASVDIHRSLRDILTWTIDLLSPEQVTVLQAVSACAGFDIGLAQRLTPQVEVLDPIETLVRFGIVRTAGEAAGASRFRLLEPIRTHVHTLLSPDDRSRFRDRHAQAMLSDGSALRSRMRGADQRKGLARLDAEADNFRLALDWLNATDPASSLELWTNLEAFWTSRHRHREGLRRFERTAALVPERTLGLSRATSRYVSLAFDLDGSVKSKALNLRSLALAREVGDAASEVEALGGIVMAAVVEGDVDTARKTADDVARISASLDDPEIRWKAAQAGCFATMAMFGAQSVEMRDAYQTALDAAIESRRVDFEMNSRGNLAVVQIYRGEFQAAIQNAERAVDLARNLESHLLNWCLGTLAIALAETGQIDRAVQALAEAAQDVAVLAVTERISDVLSAAMAVTFAAGDPLLAARIRGTLDAMYTADPSIAQAENLQLLDRIMGRVRRKARQVEVELAFLDGRASDPVEVLKALPDRLAAAPAGAAHRAEPLRHGELTRRETEVFALVGAGRSDPQIAEALFISPKTASVHVANIKAKLGLSSRLDVALRARELGLRLPSGGRRH